MMASDVLPRAGQPAPSPLMGMPVSFVPAIVAGMVVGTVVLWAIAIERPPAAQDPSLAQLVPWARLMASADERDQFLYHVGLVLTAFGGLIGAWFYGRFRGAALSMPAATQPGSKRGRTPRGALGNAASEHRRPSSHPRPRWVGAVQHVLVIAAVGSLLYVPDFRGMAGTFLERERFHHWTFFAIAPTHAYLSGMVPVQESYSQYGVGLPVIVGNLCRLLGGFSHANVVWLGMVYGVVYFSALYALLYAWLGEGRWAVAALALAIFLQQFCGLNPPEVLWQYPSSTILRSPFDVWMFLLLTGHMLRGNWTYLVVASCVVSLAMFWESDTGMYLASGLLAYATYFWIDDVRARGWSAPTACRYLATLAIAPIGFLLLTRSVVGDALTTAVFWNRFLEPLRLFHSGFGMLPMPVLRLDNLHLFITPGVYVLVGVLALAAALGLTGKPWRGGYLLGAFAIYGAGVYHQYVGRSDPGNWFHVCLPAVILTFMLTRSTLQTLETHLRDRMPLLAGARIGIRLVRLVPFVVLGTAIVLLADAPTVRSYPGILSGRRFPPGVDWDLPGVGFRTLHSRLVRDRLATVAGRMREEVPAEERVAILSDYDGILYAMANRRPFSRFVPLYPAVTLHSQVEDVSAALLDPHVHYVFWDRDLMPESLGTYLATVLGQIIRKEFELVDIVARFEVWRRRPPAPAA